MLKTYVLLFIVSLCGLQQQAHAAQWQALPGTAHYRAAYDEESIRLAPSGRLAIWLHFTPRGDGELKSAVKEYKDKRYRSHMEYYEIDCGYQTALLGSINILGASKKQFKRLQPASQAEPILPGSILDITAQRVCPVISEDVEETNDSSEPDQTKELDGADTATISDDSVQQIEILKKKASSIDATAETWKELGNIYFDTGQSELAINAYQKALALQPDDTNVLNDQGAMYRQKGDFHKALANFEKANALDPNNLESLYNSGYIYAFDLNNIPKALVIWRRYLEQESKSETARQVQSFIERYGK
jgi:tetratricopeptide (TPR) repeat protein